MGTNLQKINPTSYECYTQQGPGIGMGKNGFDILKKATGKLISRNEVCLEIGYGQGELIEFLGAEVKCEVHGVEIADACLKADPINRVAHLLGNNIHLRSLDVCHEPLPYENDMMDFVFCTETIEHLSNPYYMVAEVKRVLKHKGMFILSFPQPEDNLGYGGGDHAHVYPGFLLRDSFERFMMQLYFHMIHREQNGSTAYYVFKNYKGDKIVDVFEVISGNYEEEELYKCLRNF